MRLNSFLARSGIAARRKCDDLIREGQIRVNDLKITDPGFKIEPDSDVVLYNTNRICLNEDLVYILLNKPRGFVCSLKDEKKRKTILDLVDTDQRIFPVGRLDINTIGVILLTNDGDLSNHLTHPRYKVQKIYVAEVHRNFTDVELKKINKRVMIGPREFVTVNAKRIKSKKPKIEFTVHSGKKHLIKRVAGMLKLKVVSLERTEFCGLRTKKLPRGGWRYLTGSEVLKLHRSVNFD